MIKNKYKDDFERVGAGKYEYTGKFYRLPMNEKRKKQTGMINLAIVICFFVLEIVAGMLNPDSSRTGWIVFPYFFLFLPMAYMALGAFAYLTVPLKMQNSQYQNSLVRLRRSCIAILVLAGINILMDLIYIFIHFSDIQLYMEIMYLLCFVFMELTGFFYGKIYDRMYGGIVIDD